MRKPGTIATTAGCVAALMLAGCASSPHRDVMIFGTQTKFGIDIARPPESTTPEFTVGYKRQEFVYLPLIVNAQDSAVCTSPTCDEVMYRGTRGPDGEVTTDAYSVFASFGAQFGGGGSATEGGLAQFFATGVAAQELGNNTSIGRALSVQPADADAVRQLNEANETLVGTYRASLSEADRRAFDEKREVERKTVAMRGAMIELIVERSKKNGAFDVATWNANVALLPDADWAAEKSVLGLLATEKDVREDLANFHAFVVEELYELLTK